MASFGIIFMCLQAFLIHNAFGQQLPCNANAQTLSLANLPSGCLGQTPLTVTSATFTPLTNSVANQAGLPGPSIQATVPNLQFGDVSLTGDLPIGGTIKVSGCFPVYGMVAVDGVVPSAGSAVVNTGCGSPNNIPQQYCAK